MIVGARTARLSRTATSPVETIRTDDSASAVHQFADSNPDALHGPLLGAGLADQTSGHLLHIFQNRLSTALRQCWNDALNPDRVIRETDHAAGDLRASDIDSQRDEFRATQVTPG
jgi:hypothetical protein